MPSVTQILDSATDPEIVAWYRRNGFTKCDRVSQAALRVGSLLDGLVQQDLRGFAPVAPTATDPEAVSCWTAWQAFKVAHPEFAPSVVGLQTELVDGDLLGHPDFQRAEAHRWGITDLKCSRSIYPKYWVQTAKYWDMTRKQAGAPKLPSYISILRLDKQTGLFEYQEIEDIGIISHLVEVFDAYRTIYDYSLVIRNHLRQQLEEEILCITAQPS